MKQSLNKTVSLLNALGYEVVIRYRRNGIAEIAILQADVEVVSTMCPSTNRKIAVSAHELSKQVLSPISGKPVKHDDPDIEAAFPG